MKAKRSILVLALFLLFFFGIFLYKYTYKATLFEDKLAVEDCLKLVSDNEKYRIDQTLKETKNYKLKKEVEDDEQQYFDKYANYLTDLVSKIAEQGIEEGFYEIKNIGPVQLAIYKDLKKNSLSSFARSFLITSECKEKDEEWVFLQLNFSNVYEFACRFHATFENFKFIMPYNYVIPKRFFIQFTTPNNTIKKNLIDDSFTINLQEFEGYGVKCKFIYIFVFKDKNWAVIGKNTVKSKNNFVKKADDVLGWNISFGIAERVN